MKKIKLTLLLFFVILTTSISFSLLVYKDLNEEYGIPYYLGGSDDLTYESQALELKGRLGFFDAEEVKGAINSPFHNSPGFVWFLTRFVDSVEVVTKYDTLHFRLFNCFLFASAAIIWFLTIRRFHFINDETSFIITLGTFSIPFILYINSFVFRDTIILLLLVMYSSALCSLYNTLTSKGSSLKFITITAWILVIVYLMLPLRSLYSIVLIFVYFLSLFNYFTGTLKVFHRRLLYSITLIIFSLMAAFLYDMYSMELLRFFDLIDSYGSYVSEKATGLTSIIFDQPLLITAVMRILFSVFYPLPEFGFGYKFFLQLYAFVQFVCFPLIVYGYIRLFSLNYMRPLLFLFTILYLGVVWGTYTFRHFYYILPFYPLFFYYGLKSIKDQGLYKFLPQYLSLILFLCILFLIVIIYKVL